MTRVLIVDDERIVQELFSYYISSAADRYVLAGMLKDAGNAEIYCAGARVDLILMDVCTANCESGIAATARIRKKYAWIKIIIVTSTPDYRFIEKARAAGANSFWYKEVSTEELLDVMDRTMQGESVYPQNTPSVKVGLADSCEFTPKELEVLYYLADNKGLHQIAQLMGVDYSTTRTHIKNLKEKTGAKDIVGLCALAVRSKIVLPEY